MTQNKKQKYAPPKTRKEAAERIIKLTNHIYNYKGDTDEMAAALVQAAYLMIGRLDDPTAQKAHLISMFDSTYDRIES